MPPVNKEDVLNALARIADPATGETLVSAELVQGLVVRDGHVSFAIEVPVERGAAAEPLREQAEAAVMAGFKPAGKEL